MNWLFIAFLLLHTCTRKANFYVLNAAMSDAPSLAVLQRWLSAFGTIKSTLTLNPFTFAATTCFQ